MATSNANWNKAVDESDCANVQRRLVHRGRTSAVVLQALRNNAQEDAQHHIEHRPVALYEVAQPLRDRQHPLGHGQARENMVRQVRRCLHHTPCVARRAHAPAFARIGYEVVVPAVITPRPGKAVGEDAAFEVFAKRLADIRLWSVVVALPVELACAGKFIPSLEMFGNGLVKKGALGLARVVELGFCTRLPTRVRMRVSLRWRAWGSASVGWVFDDTGVISSIAHFSADTE
jgi:hypothetical protein